MTLLAYVYGLVWPSSSARLAIPEVVDRPCWNRVESAYWSGDSLKIFFLFDPSLTSGMSVVLMWGHSLRHRPFIKQHMSAGRVAHRKRLRHRPPHLTETCVRVELMVSQRRRQWANIKKTFFEKLMNIQYLNLPPYPNRWMVLLIQQGLAWRPRCVKTCCQEDEYGVFMSAYLLTCPFRVLCNCEHAHTNTMRWILPCPYMWTLNPFSAGLVFIRQNLTSVDVRFWRIETIPALNKRPEVLYLSPS